MPEEKWNKYVEDHIQHGVSVYYDEKRDEYIINYTGHTSSKNHLRVVPNSGSEE